MTRNMWKICLISVLAAVHCQIQDKTIAVQCPRISLTDLVNGVFPSNSTSCPCGEVCVPFYLCSNETNTVIENGHGLINIRGDWDDETEGPCGDYLEMCCGISETTDVPVITPKPAPEGCGFRNEGGVGYKITGNKDNEAEFGEFPWMVAILTMDTTVDKIGHVYKCGGSLVAPNVVLTAAHCVETTPADTLLARAGEWDTQTKNELLASQDRHVIEVVINPKYERRGLYNDAALLFLKSGFDLAEHIKPICLPPPNYNFDYATCFATGWGKDNFGQSGKYQAILKKIDLPIVPKKLCQKQLRATRLSEYFSLHRSFICALGEAGKDTCKGDGGSPLVCPIPNSPNRYYQAGIVAWGIGCGNPNVPGVYASVAELQPWIEEQLEFQAINQTFYTPY